MNDSDKHIITKDDDFIDIYKERWKELKAKAQNARD